LTYTFKANYKEAILKYTVILLHNLSLLLIHTDICTEKETWHLTNWWTNGHRKSILGCPPTRYSNTQRSVRFVKVNLRLYYYKLLDATTGQLP